MAKFGKGFPDRPRGSRNPDGTPGPLLNLLPSTGAGCFTVPAVVCLQKVFPEFFQGRWFCFHGDGTSHASEPSLELTAVGSPTTQTLPAYNGLNCAPVTRTKFSATNYYKTVAIDSPSGDFSSCVVSQIYAPMPSSNTYMAQDDQSTNRAWYTRQVTPGKVQANVYNGTTMNAAQADNAVQGGADQIVIQAFKFVGAGTVNQNTLYVNGISVAGLTNASPIPVVSTPIMLGNSIGPVDTICCAFFTEYCLTQADVTRIQNYLYPLPQGTRGEPLTFARNSLASMTAPDGTVIWLPPNRPAISGGIKMRPSVTNLLLYSEQFDNTGGWSRIGIPPTITSNFATAPDGSSTADQITIESGGGSYVRQSLFGGSLVAGATYTFSCWVKSGPSTSASKVCLTTNDTTAWNTGVSTAFDLTSSWTRVSVSFNTGTTTQSYIMIGNINAAGSSDPTISGNVLLWGAQLEAGTIASDYVRSEGTQGVSAAETCTVPMPGVRTNLGLWSEDFTQGYWSKKLVSTVSASSIAPDGNNTATKMVETATAGTHNIVQSAANPVIVGTTYTFSIYLKAAERHYAIIGQDQSGTGYFSVDLTAGTFTSKTIGTYRSRSIVPVGNGWYRVSISYTASNTGAPGIVFIEDAFEQHSYTGDGTSGIYIWGAQLETGPCATDYIPTTSAAGSVSSLSTKEGAAEISIVPTWTGANPSNTIFFLDGNSAATARFVFMFPGSASMQVQDGDGHSPSVIANPTPEQHAHYLSRWSASDNNGNGLLQISNLTAMASGILTTFSGFPSFDSTIAIGNHNGVQQPLGATLSDIKLYPYPKK